MTLSLLHVEPGRYQARLSPSFLPLLSLSFRILSRLSSLCRSICAFLSSLLTGGAAAAATAASGVSLSSSSSKSLLHVVVVVFVAAAVGVTLGGVSVVGVPQDGTGVANAAAAAEALAVDCELTVGRMGELFTGVGAFMLPHSSCPQAASSSFAAAETIFKRSAPVLLISLRGLAGLAAGLVPRLSLRVAAVVEEAEEDEAVRDSALLVLGGME